MHRRRSGFAILVSLGLAVAPKCPACLLAYVGLVGSATFSTYAVYSSWLPPLMAGSLALSVGSLAWQARHDHFHGPTLTALVAAFAIFAGRFWLHQPPFVYTGMALLAGAALWSALPRRALCAGCPSPGESR
ncbi:MAG TPA: hypothetical protein VFR31_21550 [Thermoanaerobaculia bacterium]|nr:hypothetical protein [Thermoanaerobaculia bacterium]